MLAWPKPNNNASFGAEVDARIHAFTNGVPWGVLGAHAYTHATNSNNNETTCTWAEWNV